MRTKTFILPLLAALLSSAIMPGTAAATLTFNCVEPSRYANILPIFNDDPNAYFDYFKPAQRRLPNLQSCRALIVNGSIGSGDAEALLGKIVAGQGGLAVLYLAFDGSNLVEEAKMALIVRAFALKTSAVRGPRFVYSPDFATFWREPVALARSAGNSPAAVAPFSPLDGGLRLFKTRKDLLLPVAKEHAFCLDGCWAVWYAGVDRTRSASQAPAPAGPAPHIDATVARRRALLSHFIDSGQWAAANDPVLKRVPISARFWTEKVEHSLRQVCEAELSVVKSLESSLSQSFDASVKRKLDPSSVEELTPLFERFNRAGARIEKCYAVAYERGRMANFRRQCPKTCDASALNDTFSKQAEKLLQEASQIK